MVIMPGNDSKGQKEQWAALPAIPLEISLPVSKEPSSSLRAAAHTYVRKVTDAKEHLTLRDSPKVESLTFLPVCHVAAVITGKAERETPGLQSGCSTTDTW